MRRGGLSVWVRLYIYICVCVCVCRQKTRLFAVLPLENRHEMLSTARRRNLYSSKDA